MTHPKALTVEISRPEFAHFYYYQDIIYYSWGSMSLEIQILRRRSEVKEKGKAYFLDEREGIGI